MRWCLVGLIWNVITALFAAIFRVMGFLVMLMITSISSLFIGVNRATDRIAASWIEDAAGRGMNIGYRPAGRAGMKVAAWLLLIVGWFLTIWVIYLIVAAIAN